MEIPKKPQQVWDIIRENSARFWDVITRINSGMFCLEKDFDLKILTPALQEIIKAYDIKYAGSKQKIRNINEFNEDKFGISKFLAERIMQSLQTDEKSDVTTTRQILSFFKNARGLCCLQANALFK